jgi:hypothetical protein
MSVILKKVEQAVTAYKNQEFTTLAEACSHHKANLQIANILESNPGIFTPDFFVDEKVYESRMEFCRGCEDLSAPPDIPNTCKLCNCQVQVITTMVLKSCPKGLWNVSIV